MTMLDLDPIKARLAAATPGPWDSCPDDGCKCSAIMSPDYPVAEVTKGAWGDDFPAVRLVGESSLNMKAEAYMEQITYGEVSEQQFLANRAFIREAPSDIAALLAEIERLRALVMLGDFTNLRPNSDSFKLVQQIRRERSAGEQKLDSTSRAHIAFGDKTVGESEG